MTSPCVKCGKRYKILTKEGTCVFCYQDEHGTWSPEFQEEYKKK
jgi:hypothetical protein